MPDTTAELTNQVQDELKTQALTVVQRAQNIRIVDQSSYEEACSLLINEIKPFRKRWKDFWDGLREPAYRAYQAVLDKYNAGDKPLETAEKQIKAEINRWDAEQEKIRRELQEKAQREAEAAAQTEIDKQAVFAELSGADAEQVAAIAAQPVVVVAPPVLPTYEKVSGVSKRENWKARVTDMKKLCAAIGKGLVPVTYVLPNESALNQRAKADRSTLNIPGVVAYDDPVITGRVR